MKRAFAVLLVGLFAGLIACNYDVGECWLPGDETSGAGGGVIYPTGGGGFGNVPWRPQSTDGDYASYDLCASQTVTCTVTWKADSSTCGGSATTCTTLYQGNHASLDEAKDYCEMAYGVGKGSGALSCGPCEWGTGASDEKCKRICDKAYDKCMDKCKDKKCRDDCFKDYIECLRECDR